MVTENCIHNNVQNNDGDLFNQECVKCGVSIIFADDASIVLQTKRGECNKTSSKLDHLLTELKIFYGVTICNLI